MRGFRFALAHAAARTRAELQGTHGRRLSNCAAAPARPSFGIAFDIDGVILRGRSPIGGSPQAIRRLYSDDGTLKIPFLFLTNGNCGSKCNTSSNMLHWLVKFPSWK